MADIVPIRPQVLRLNKPAVEAQTLLKDPQTGDTVIAVDWTKMHPTTVAIQIEFIKKA